MSEINAKLVVCNRSLAVGTILRYGEVFYKVDEIGKKFVKARETRRQDDNLFSYSLYLPLDANLVVAIID